MKNGKQSALDLGRVNKMKSYFGSSSLKHHPKTARAISTKDIMHVVLKSELAHGVHSFLNFEREILKLVQRLAVQLGVRIKDVVVMSNHIHISLRTFRRASFQNYLRALNGLIARKVLGAERHRPASLRNFFKGRPFSRIVDSGRKSFRALIQYFELNRLEKMGFTKAQSRDLGLLQGRFDFQKF